ncbi:hypothetical protein HUJ04_009093 [Dendroctonus ponderosae]|nr:hypothetical protein HUJ04_009093 [Dendroctonus ponderosae]
MRLGIKDKSKSIIVLFVFSVSSACNKTVSNKSISILSSWARRSILNRMATIGNIGFGLLILLVLWIITIIVFVVAIKLQSNIAWVALGLSTALTVVLLTIPTEKHVSLHVPNIVEKDYNHLQETHPYFPGGQSRSWTVDLLYQLLHQANSAETL